MAALKELLIGLAEGGIDGAGLAFVAKLFQKQRVHKLAHAQLDKAVGAHPSGLVSGKEPDEPPAGLQALGVFDLGVDRPHPRVDLARAARRACGHGCDADEAGVQAGNVEQEVVGIGKPHAHPALGDVLLKVGAEPGDGATRLAVGVGPLLHGEPLEKVQRLGGLRRIDGAARAAIAGGLQHFAARLPHKVAPPIRLAAEPGAEHEAAAVGRRFGEAAAIGDEFGPGARGAGGVEPGLLKVVAPVVEPLRGLKEGHGIEPPILAAQHLQRLRLHPAQGFRVLLNEPIQRPHEALLQIAEVLPEVDVKHVRRAVPGHREQEGVLLQVARKLQASGVGHPQVGILAAKLVVDRPPHLAVGVQGVGVGHGESASGNAQGHGLRGQAHRRQRDHRRRPLPHAVIVARCCAEKFKLSSPL